MIISYISSPVYRFCHHKHGKKPWLQKFLWVFSFLCVALLLSHLFKPHIENMSMNCLTTDAVTTGLRSTNSSPGRVLSPTLSAPTATLPVDLCFSHCYLEVHCCHWRQQPQTQTGAQHEWIIDHRKLSMDVCCLQRSVCVHQIKNVSKLSLLVYAQWQFVRKCIFFSWQISCSITGP